MTPERRLRAAARRCLDLAWLALAWERLWPALWPAVGVIGLFLVLALADVLPLLPGWLHALVLVGLLAALVRALRHLVRLRLPGRAMAQRRLERDSGLEHRPLTALDDTLAAGHDDPATAALWQHHRARALAAVKRLRVAAPAPGLARHDRLALRVALGSALVATLIAAGGAAPENVARALAPTLVVGAPEVPATLEVWVTPPDYTGLPPVLLTGATERDDIIVPGGSVVLAQVHDGRGQPAVSYGADATAMAAVDDRTWRAEMTLDADGSDTARRLLSVSQGEATLGAWPVAVVPDRVPEIAFAEPPEATRRTALRLTYVARDDHGVDGVKAFIARPDGDPDAAIVLPLPLPGRGLKEARATSYHDLTAHPWAGLDVTVTLEATDGPGRTGASEPYTMALPERVFTHPIARAVIEQRKRLTVEPGERLDIAREIAKIGIVPRHYDHDLVVYLSLMTSRSRLVHDDGADAVGEVQGILWETALRIEEGRVSMAERRLRELQRELMEALNNDAPDDELERIMDELQRVMEAFMQALNERLQHQLEQGVEPMEVPPDARLLQQQDLQEMLDRMREMMRMGARDSARQMLSQLQELLENLRNAPMQTMRQRQPNPTGRMLDQLQDLMRRQQELLDQTFQQSRRRPQDMPQQGMPQPGQEPGETGRMGAREQEALRRMLGEMMRQLGEATGEIPNELGRAERFMRDSREALQLGQPGEAVGPQTGALDQLQQGARQMLEQMLGQQPGEGQDGRFGRFTQQQGTDPFGRPLDNAGAWDDGNVAIPEAADLQRAREVLNELRRRAGERERPSPELDYIDRLLRRF